MRNDSDSNDDLVYLLPDGEALTEKPDAGASPKLRRSTRKRKSTAVDEANKTEAEFHRQQRVTAR